MCNSMISSLQTVDDKQTTLSTQGVNRAIHLDKVFGRGNTAPGTYNTPDIIYAMNQKVRI